jgi:hypothetical protein
MADDQGTPYPSRAACFVDLSGDDLEPGATCDAHGNDLVGVSPDRDSWPDGYLWWGTDRAPWLLHEHWCTAVVYGRIGRARWRGHFVGTPEAAIEYAETHGVTVDYVASSDLER